MSSQEAPTVCVASRRRKGRAQNEKTWGQEADIHPGKEAQEFPGDASRRFQHGSHTAGPRSRGTDSKTHPKSDTLKRDQDNGQRSDGRKDG